MLSAVARVVVMDGEELGGMEEEGAADTEVTSLRERSNSSLSDYGTLALSADGFMDSTWYSILIYTVTNALHL